MLDSPQNVVLEYPQHSRVCGGSREDRATGALIFHGGRHDLRLEPGSLSTFGGLTRRGLAVEVEPEWHTVCTVGIRAETTELV